MPNIENPIHICYKIQPISWEFCRRWTNEQLFLLNLERISQLQSDCNMGMLCGFGFLERLKCLLQR